MEYCYNHPERKTYSICHSCGKHFCEESLTSGAEYYYCSSPECQAKLKAEEKKTEIYPEEITCPNCGSIVEIKPEAIQSAGFRCPECETFIAIANGIPESMGDKNYLKLITISNMGDIAIIKSMLDDAGIDYYTTGENSMYSAVEFYVEENQINLAKEILKDFEFHLFGLSANNGE